ncbi:MAG: hypothetical protein O2892_14705 [Actinomycetota bacterium]|nr:hypothetical protein [Actinomycetota bacterium]MDA2950270.1 hypothetical protein [Actinomycetota bacterium]
MLAFIAGILGVLALAYQDRHVASVVVGAHHTHTFAVTPIEMTANGVVLQLLRRDDRPVADEKCGIPAVEIGAVDSAIRRRDVDPHVRPEQGAGGRIHLDPIRFALESVRDCPQPASIGTQRQDGRR